MKFLGVNVMYKWQHFGLFLMIIFFSFSLKKQLQFINCCRYFKISKVIQAWTFKLSFDVNSLVLFWVWQLFWLLFQILAKYFCYLLVILLILLVERDPYHLIVIFMQLGFSVSNWQKVQLNTDLLKHVTPIFIHNVKWSIKTKWNQERGLN